MKGIVGVREHRRPFLLVRYNTSMIYLFTGSDTEKARAKAFAWVLAAKTKQPDAPYVRMGADELTEAALFDAIGTQGLFFSKTLVLLDDPFSKKESGELVLEYLKELQASPNPIAILAPKLIPARVKKIAQVSEKVFELEGKEKEAQGFNFALAHALSSKTEGALWLELQRAYRRGEAPEALHGLLHWKARELMKKGGAEGRALSVSLIQLLSDSRSGGLSLKEELERFALR